MAEMITVEVAYATPDKQEIVVTEVPVGTTALEAIDASGIRDLFEDLQVDEKAIGIFSKKTKPTQILKQGDRVEIYRPLIADPKEVRKARAARAKEKRAADKEG